MKAPKIVRAYCPKCRKHTEHIVKIVKKRARSSRHPESQSQRRFKRKIAGYGGFPRPNPKGEGKPTKKLNLSYQCNICKKQHMRKGFRAKKYELQ